MDLKFSASLPTPGEQMAVDEALGKGGEAARHMLLPVLQSIQSHIGWISPGALNYACRRLHVPPAEGYGVAEFYGLLSTEPRPPCVVHVCDDLACRLAGSREICATLETTLGPAGAPQADGRSTWLRSPCLGQCELAPAAFVHAAGEKPREVSVKHTNAESLTAILRQPELAAQLPAEDLRAAISIPQAGQTDLVLLKWVGAIRPESLEDYRYAGGYLALAKAKEMGAAAVLAEMATSELVGRGGAAFPSGRKWQAVAAAPAPRYLVCNADESEPGTFKDRILMEGNPFRLLEAMTIAAFATGCSKGFLYIRGEYHLAAQRMQTAIDAAGEAGLLEGFEIKIRMGGGAYICGEETALFNSIEGFRGEPRNKPPFPTQVGLFGRPTLVNNVETFCNVPSIVLEGAARYVESGTKQSKGNKLFCVSGHVRRPGLYEFPFGITLRELLDAAGGVGGSGRLQAVLMGGAAGGFLSPAEVDTPLTFEGLRGIGASLGSAVVMPFDDTVDLRSVLRQIAAFFREESCGQCVPCRVGTVRQDELLGRLSNGGDAAKEFALFRDVAQVMRDASICGLGQTAPSAIESALLRFDLFPGGAIR
ncbi:MAG: NAD(P)H-dependent oxidoreductase subunit E [Bryobacteraceae bacterium]